MNKDQLAITRDGISQAERWFDNLVPSYVQIDSREIPDLVDFLFGLSKQIHYYNDADKATGNWEDLFTSDPNLIIILLSRLDLADLDIHYAEKKENIIRAKTDEEAIKALSEFLVFIHELYYKMNITLSRFEEGPDTPEAETMIYYLGETENTGNTIFSYYAEALDLFPGLKIPQLKKGLDKFKKSSGKKNDFFGPGETDTRERICDSLVHLNTAFDELMSRLARLGRAAKEYVKDRRFMERRYQPQIGLFLTFLELYGYVRKRLNGLVGKHLDYYYQEVLGIDFEELKPDSVHLVAEMEEQVGPVTIGTNDLLMAEGAESPIYFMPERAQVLSKAKIKSIKTVFLSNYRQIDAIPTVSPDVNEVQLFKAEHPLFNPAEYIKGTGKAASWAAMGEDQHDLPKSERTMEDAEPGIAIVSSLFYQVEGERKFTVSFELKSEESQGLNKYIKNYSAAKKEKNRDIVEHKLFSRAFRLMYTAGEGWESVSRYSAKVYNTDKDIFRLEVYFELSASEKAFDCYSEAVHKELLHAELPVLKLLLNPHVEHYAYSFLRLVQIDRITIDVNVTGFRAVKLQNNVGPLSTAAPFQPFGPQPSIGSYLDIKNSNVFNRYLRNFTVRINWLELPGEKGGFATHYNGYGVRLENESFKVDLSALSGGMYKPESLLRQQFQLFADDEANDELQDQTEMKGVDFKKIEFQNDPQLRKEMLINEPFFRDGAIRLELCAPDEAFGHRLFPKVFPEVILHNSKKFRKKQPVPNQPYVPVIKTIELDYEAGFSESFKEGNILDQQFQLFHLYPFGCQKIFPGGEKKNYWFMPRFDNFSNLMIGLENVEPNTELSLLFQMEEKSFHHTLHEPDPVTWSYLEADNWIEFRPRDLIANTTDNFINSGIVCLRMPAIISTGNSILPKDIFWIKASSTGKHGVYGCVKSVMVNGFMATRVLDKNSGKKLNLLGPNKINGFSKTVKGIQSVLHLFPSFGGSAAETNERYYVRVSERLRHKNRPLQIRDLAQILLKEFPQLLIVKLFNSKREKFSMTPGIDLHIVLIPRESDGGGFVTEQPRVSLSELRRVKKFVSSVVSPFAKIEVGNAVYERVKVFCKVVFDEKQEADSNILRRRFIADANRYIAPWLYGADSNIKIGSRIYRAEFLIYLKALPYVKYITGFSLIHFSGRRNPDGDELYSNINDSAVTHLDVIEGATPASVLIPSPFHIIEVIREMDAAMPEKSGIGNLVMGEEFLVTDGKQEGKALATVEDDDQSFGIIISHNIE